jgi:hypothetical protein
MVYNNTTMTSSCPPSTSSYGADPANIKWKIVRGDTAKLRIEFYENDETTAQNTTGWTYASTAYDYKGDSLDTLQTTAGAGYVEITALPAVTATWGLGYSNIVAELAFDLQVTLSGGVIWTPVIGTITVLPDVTDNP